MVDAVKKDSHEFDAIVVGSGITGGWAAKELTEKGLKVLLIERGRPMEHRKDYVHEFTPPWKAPNQTLADRERDMRDYAVQSRMEWGSFSWANRQYWINDRENPYVQVRPYRWHRAEVLGGRSLLWGRQTYRWSDLDFEANKRDGHGNDWPIRYADVAPWYAYVERYIGVSGQAEGLPQLPDGEFLPPMELNAVERLAKRRIEARWQDRRLTIGRVANLTVPHEGRGPCQYRNICNRGCSFGGYFSSLSATLPAAQKTGLLTVRSNSLVEAVEVDPKTRRATGVRLVDTMTMERHRVTARVVFLCASALASTQVLMQSRSEAFPTGVGNHSDQLGRYLVDQMSALMIGEVEGLGDHNVKGRRANNTYMPRFRNLRGRDAGVEFDRGYVYQCGGIRVGWDNQAAQSDDFGADMKHRLATPGKWLFFMQGWCESLPLASNRVTLHDRLTDKYGLPQLRFDVAYGSNELRMAEDAMERAREMMLEVGAKNVVRLPNSEPGASIHDMGGARMGLDPNESVLNARNQVHGVPNLFVTDGAAMASAAAVNPSLTFMALTVRAVDFAVAQIKAGQL